MCSMSQDKKRLHFEADSNQSRKIHFHFHRMLKTAELIRRARPCMRRHKRLFSVSWRLCCEAQINEAISRSNSAGMSHRWISCTRRQTAHQNDTSDSLYIHDTDGAEERDKGCTVTWPLHFFCCSPTSGPAVHCYCGLEHPRHSETITKKSGTSRRKTRTIRGLAHLVGQVMVTL